ncbi:cytidine deaminase [Treponema phagedenis]|nr:cytidine deaminase [Treponema phagedenis]
MDIWDELYIKAKKFYHPQYISPFIYSNHVVSAIEANDGSIFTGFCIRSCSGVGNLCAERVAAINMLNNGGQTKIKKIITFRDDPPINNLSVPCGACREFLMQLSIENKKTQILLDYYTRKIVTLGELIPQWWGYEKLDEKNKS